MVSGGYLPPNYFAVFFRAIDIGVLGDAFPEELTPDVFNQFETPTGHHILPDTTDLGALVMKIAIFLVGLYFVNLVMLNFLIAIMADTFERVKQQEKVLAWQNKALRLLEVHIAVYTQGLGRRVGWGWGWRLPKLRKVSRFSAVWKPTFAIEGLFC